MSIRFVFKQYQLTVFSVVHIVLSSNSPTSCGNKHSLSRSHVNRDLYQGKVFLVVDVGVLS